VASAPAACFFFDFELATRPVEVRYEVSERVPSEKGVVPPRRHDFHEL
jgi:hypothetical protein